MNETFNINDKPESEEEEEDQIYVPIQVGDQNLKIKYLQLWKYSKLIRDKYIISEARKCLSNDLETYQKEQKIKNDSIYTFFEIINEKQFKILNDQYKDLFKLSIFFKCKQLQRILNEFYETHISKCDFLLEQINDEIAIQNETQNPTFEITNQMKTTLIKQINDCLQNEKFNKLPISLIYNILQNTPEDEISNDLLFDFIKQSIDDHFILFSFLHVDKLSDEKYSELESIYRESKTNKDGHEKYFNYLPCNLTYIFSLKSTINQITQQNNEQKDIINQLTHKLNEAQKENDKLSAKLNQTEQELTNKKEENDKLSEDKKRILLQLENEQMRELEFDSKTKRKFDGIMRYLVSETKGNIHDNGTIEITSNSILNNSHPKNLVDYETKNRYQCLYDKSGDTYICFDFKDMLIQISKYTIQSNDCVGKNWYNLRNWIIQVSDDGKNWEEIDRHSDDQSLNGYSIVVTFTVQKQNSGFHRFVKLQQTGETWSQPKDPYHFFFPYLEFYGKIRIPKNKFME